MTFRRFLAVGLAVSLFAAPPSAPAWANEDDGVLDEKRNILLNKEKKKKDKKAAAAPKRPVKDAPKTDAKKSWARDYEQARNRRIRDLQNKLERSMINHDLEDTVFNKKSRKGDPPAKRYKPLYEFLEEYRTLEWDANTQAKKLDLQKLWSQLTKYSKARVYKKTAIIAKGLQKAFNVQDAEDRVKAAKKKYEKVKTDTPKAYGRIFLAENEMKRENQEFKKLRRGLPKPMRAAFPGID